MLNRLANVIYWLCTATSILFAAGAVVVLVTSNELFGMVFCGVLAVGSYGVGRAVRYILAGH
jgi:hypothetical protein